MARKPISDRQLRWFYLTYLVTLPFLIQGGEIAKRTSAGPSWQTGVVVLLAVFAAYSGFNFHRVVLKRTATRSDPDKKRVLSIARLGRFSCAESVVLWGVLGRMFVGSPLWVAFGLYALGIFLLIAWRPRKELPAVDRSLGLE